MPNIFTVTPNPGLDRTLTVPAILHNEVLRASEVRSDAGGKGFNVARALKALGMESTALGFLGGALGRRLEEELARLGVAGAFTPIAGETRTNFVVTTPDGNDHVKVNEPGPVIAAEELAAFHHLVAARIRPGDFWVMSGSLARGLPEDFYASLIRVVQWRGAHAVLDASGSALVAGLAAAPYLVKPNALEASQAVGVAIDGEEDAYRAAQTLLDRGVQMVALSLGADGLLLADPHRSVRVRPPVIRALNTVGAGDALLAGLVWALALGYPLEEAARWGVASGSAAAALPGVDFAPLSAVREMFERCVVSI
jgi:1-phosphofructokinase family hexose kinase